MLENERPLSFAANVNVGIAGTTGDYVLVSNPDAVSGGRSGRRARRVRRRASAGRARRPARALAGRDLAAEPAPVPDACSARSGAGRRCGCCAAPTSIRSPTTARRPTEPVQGDWLLGGACLLMRRRMLERARRLGRRLQALRRGHRRRVPRREGGLGALARSRARSRATTTRP